MVKTLSPRWIKLLRDLQSAQGRMLMMVIAIGVSIFGVGTILSAYIILTREISRNYLGTHPASAFLELDQVDAALVASVLTRPDITDAEATSWVTARVEVKPNTWMPLLLFVIPDFKTLHLDTFLPESGAWPPPADTLLLERDALSLTQAKVGSDLIIQTSNGPKKTILLSGLVHDPGLAPAWQEQTLYGYITPATLTWLGEGNSLHVLKITIKDQPGNTAEIDSTVSSLSAWLKTQGHTVGEIRIPPPGMHPHQSQMNSILVMLLMFSLLALTLSAILTATMIGGLLAQQIRQIGIMKAIGAQSSQITRLYLALIVILGLAAALIGIPTGIAAGRGFAGVVGQLLNFTIYSQAVPEWVYLMLGLMGTLVPLIVALGPISAATRKPVREILTDYGVSRESFGSGKIDRWLKHIRGLDNILVLSLRNTFRRQGRLALTLPTGYRWWDVYYQAECKNRLGNISLRRSCQPPLRSGNSV